MRIASYFSHVCLLSALQQEVAESQEELALHLPPCNADADTPENVYLFEDRIFLYISSGMPE